MAFARVADAHNDHNWGSTASQSLGSPTSGNLLVLVVGTDLSKNATTPSGWTLIASYTSGTNRCWAYYKISDGTETSQSITLSGNSHWCTAYGEYSYDTGNTLVLEADTFGGVGPGDGIAAQITTTNADGLVCCFYYHHWYMPNGASLASDDGFTLREYTNYHQGSLAFGERVVTSTGDYGTNWTSAGGYAMVQFGFSEDAGGGGSSASPWYHQAQQRLVA